MAIKQTAGREILGKLAPEFARYNDDILFGEVWSREDKLSLRDRSMITISALMAQGLYPQAKSHLIMGKKHGVTKQEAVELVTQLAFYAGWPKAWSMLPMVEEVWADEEDSNKLPNESGMLFPIGKENAGYNMYFIGTSYIYTLSAKPLSVNNITFEPACRNNWHIHHAKSGGGQMLICTYGEGWYQEEGKDAVSLKPGSVITIPAEVKHWHGAKKDGWFSHLAVEIPGEDAKNEWCEPVSDEEYSKF